MTPIPEPIEQAERAPIPDEGLRLRRRAVIHFVTILQAAGFLSLCAGHESAALNLFCAGNILLWWVIITEQQPQKDPKK